MNNDINKALKFGYLPSFNGNEVLLYFTGLPNFLYIDSVILYMLRPEFLSRLWINSHFLFEHKVKPHTSFSFLLWIF